MNVRYLFFPILFILVNIFLYTGSLLSQTDLSREELLRLAREKSATWKTERAAAESLAQIYGMPVRRVYSNGRVSELQRFEDGIPIVYTTDNLNSAKTISTNKVWPGGGFGYSLSGAGQVIREWDEASVRGTHQELTGRVTQVDVPGSLSDHSTHVAGTMMATGINASAHGMANLATLRAFDWNNDQSEMTSEAAGGALVSNHSYGTITGWDYNFLGGNRWVWFGNTSVSATVDYYYGFYDLEARQWDQIAVNAPNYLIVQASGNDRGNGPGGTVTHYHVGTGTSTTYTDFHEDGGGATGYDCISHNALSKDILTVGAVNDIPSGYSGPSSVVASSFHGIGPTDDGRIKPDIVANGINLTSCISTADNAYASYSGTSMATPSVTGSVALLLEHEKNLFGFNTWRSATRKALLIHTADEAGPADGPDYIFGWGLMNTLKAAQVMTQDSASGGFNIRQYTLSQGNTISFNVESNGLQPLRVTICWTDPAGSVVSPAQLNPPNRMLVNDLDLRIVGNSTTYFPWVLNPSNPSAAATTGDNIRDNVEQVHIASPAIGLYTVQISHKGTLSGGAQNVSVIVTGASEVNNGMISGLVFNDLNGDSSNNVGEPGLSGWKVRLARQGTPWDSTLTDVNGQYSFDSLLEGTYTLTVDHSPVWRRTYPVSTDTQTINVAFGTDTSDVNFGFFNYGRISGKKFIDLNNNGSHDNGEPFLPHWKIYLSGPTSDSVVTDANGSYEFDSLFKGTYTVSEESRSNWQQTMPLSGTYSVSIDTSGSVVIDRDFGNFSHHTITGMKFHDLNGDGQFNNGEPGLAGWTIRATGPSTDSATTDAQGNYVLAGLSAGAYTIQEQLKSGWIQTTPTGPSTYQITFAPGDSTAAGRDFGNFKLGSITGMKYADINNNGSKDQNDTAISGWKIYLSENNTLEDSTLTNASGVYIFTGLHAGNYTVCEEHPSDWVQVTPPSCYAVSISGGDSVGGKDFGNFHLGSISGHVYEDRSTLGVNDGDPTVQIPWKIILEPSSSSPETTTTDGNGAYSFAHLPFDAYTVRQILPSGWTDTYHSGNPFAVILHSGLDTTGLDFGNLYNISTQLYRTATQEEWSKGTNGLFRVANSVKRKADKVFFKFNLRAPGAVNLLLKFTMVTSGKIYRAKSELLVDSLYGWSGLKDVGPVVLPGVNYGDTIHIVGQGVKGKYIKVKYQWGSLPLTSFPDTSFKLNFPGLPMPNLHNVGEELFPNGFHQLAPAFPNGLVVGIPQGDKKPHTVLHKKYSDVKKSLYDRVFNVHSHVERCLNVFDARGDSIKRQVVGLSPSKHNNRLFAEVLALKLDIAASQMGKFPQGLGELIYDDRNDPSNVFNKMSVNDIATKADSFLTCLPVKVNNIALTPGDVYQVVRNITLAFSGPMDTFSFSSKFVAKGVRPLYQVPYLQFDSNAVVPPITFMHMNEPPAPATFVLHQNYPNPFNPTTTIEFELPEQAFVTLKLYNVLGQEVVTLLDHQQMDEGGQEVQFDASNYASGLYFYRLIAEGFNEEGRTVTYQSVKKMMLVK